MVDAAPELNLHWKRAPTSWMIWYAVALHLVWAACLAWDGATGGVTAIHHLLLFMPRRCAIYLLAGVGTLAAYGLLAQRRRVSLLCVLPQQFVLMCSAVGALHAILSSTFADGVPRPRAFICADQMPALLAAVLHTFAILEFHAFELGHLLRATTRKVRLWSRG